MKFKVLLDRIERDGRPLRALYFYPDGAVFASFENEEDNPDDIEIARHGEYYAASLLAELLTIEATPNIVVNQECGNVTGVVIGLKTDRLGRG